MPKKCPAAGCGCIRLALLNQLVEAVAERQRLPQAQLQSAVMGRVLEASALEGRPPPAPAPADDAGKGKDKGADVPAQRGGGQRGSAGTGRAPAAAEVVDLTASDDDEPAPAGTANRSKPGAPLAGALRNPAAAAAAAAFDDEQQGQRIFARLQASVARAHLEGTSMCHRSGRGAPPQAEPPLCSDNMARTRHRLAEGAAFEAGRWVGGGPGRGACGHTCANRLSLCPPPVNSSALLCDEQVLDVGLIGVHAHPVCPAPPAPPRLQLPVRALHAGRPHLQAPVPLPAHRPAAAAGAALARAAGAHAGGGLWLRAQVFRLLPPQGLGAGLQPGCAAGGWEDGRPQHRGCGLRRSLLHPGCPLAPAAAPQRLAACSAPVCAPHNTPPSAGGMLWFNAGHPEIATWQQRGTLAWADQTFLLLCHELAHEWVSGHGTGWWVGAGDARVEA